MEYLEWIIKIGGAITAIVAIWRAVVFFVHLADDIKDLKRHTRENYLGIKRLTVMSHDMPLGERIIAADEYLKEGGNGEVKKYIVSTLHVNEKTEN